MKSTHWRHTKFGEFPIVRLSCLNNAFYKCIRKNYTTSVHPHEHAYCTIVHGYDNVYFIGYYKELKM